MDIRLSQLEQERNSEDLEMLPADQYKLQVEIIKAKQKYLRELKELPQAIIDSMQVSTANAPQQDVYRTAKDFLPKKEE